VHGRIDGALLFSELVTEQVEIRHALHESESRARATFENAAVGISHVAPDGRFLRFNEALCRILGWPADELITKTVRDITHPDDLSRELAQLQWLKDGKADSYAMDKRDLRKDGTIFWIRRTVSCVRRGDGSVDYFVSVVEDISAHKRAEEQVYESEALFRNTFENAAVGIAHLSSNLRWLRANEALCRIIGWPINELVTNSLQDITHPADFEAELAHIQQMRAGEIEKYAMEKRYLRKDRGFVWTQLTVSCVRKSDRSIDYFVGVVEDISAQKQAEEQVDLLMREARHRTKNILGLVQAVARQTAASEPEEFVERFTERIQALAANQDLLVKSGWQGADVEELVRVQLAHFSDLVGSRIAVRGPKLRLNAAAAQAVGLAVHELATNASKYGALSTDGGRVDVDWRSDARSFAINWTEHGGPPVSPPGRRGFGSTVVESMAKRAVGGEVELDYAPSGFEWHLTCPAANALEARPI
jgi:PAS domain S-box-containing protein